MAMLLKCAYCLKESNSLHRDHVVPMNRGGPDNATNIVMACQQCNSSKSDLLPSEWLGERCPAQVLRIESRVNAKIERSFKARRERCNQSRRHVEEKEPMCAYTLTNDGDVQYMGEIVSETDATIRINAISFFLFYAGIWDTSGKVYDFPRSECVVYMDRESCAEGAIRVMNERDKPMPKMNAMVLE